MREFEELDYQETPLGELALRRRCEPRLGGREVFEIKLGDAFLMSSLFTAGEEALAELALSAHGGTRLDVVVGGLGLGHTAAAVLAHPGVASLLVVELMAPVIRWHRQQLVPLGATLTQDPRCRMVNGDFFASCVDPHAGFDPVAPERRYHAVLLDIDHSPHHTLDGGNRGFYGRTGLEALTRRLQPNGVFGLWSNDPPHQGFCAMLRRVFSSATAHVVAFDNPYTGGQASSTVYVARAGGPDARGP